jgi:hypothetical protein
MGCHAAADAGGSDNLPAVVARFLDARWPEALAAHAEMLPRGMTAPCTAVSRPVRDLRVLFACTKAVEVAPKRVLAA